MHLLKERFECTCLFIWVVYSLSDNKSFHPEQYKMFFEVL